MQSLPLLLLTGLALLAADVLTGVLNALAQIGFRLADRTDVSREVADLLLVDALDNDGVGVGRLKADGFGRVENDGVREANVDGSFLPPSAAAR